MFKNQFYFLYKGGCNFVIEKENKNAVGYVRVSSRMQAEEGLSLAYQHKEITEYAIKNDLELLEICEDAGVSGYTDNKLIEYSENNDGRISLKRKGMIQLLNYIKKKKIGYLLVTKNDRLGRDSDEKAFLKRLCKKYHVKIIFIEQPHLTGTDPDSPTEALINGIFDLLDEFYSMNLSLEIRKIHRSLAEEGAYTGGKVPIGYKLKEVPIDEKRSKKYLVIDEETAPTIRLIYKMYLDGYGYNQIAQHLNNIKAPGAANWKFSNIGVILKNENYYTRVWNRSESRRVEGRVKDKSQWVYSHSEEHETIISQEDFMKVQEMIGAKAKNLNRAKKGEENENSEIDYRGKGKYILTGMIHCKGCGKRYVADITTNKVKGTINHYFVCPTNRSLPKGEKCGNSLNMAKLDYLVWLELCQMLTKEQMIKEINNYLETKNQENRTLNQKLYGWQKELIKLQKEYEKMFSLLSKIDPEEDIDLFDIYNSRLKLLRGSLRELEHNISDFGEPFQEDMHFPAEIDIVKSEFLLHPDYYPHLKFEVFSAIVNNLVERIEVTKLNEKESEIEIFFRINHPTLKKAFNMRSLFNRKKLSAKSRSGESKETIMSKILGIFEDFSLGIAHSGPSPFYEIK